MVMVPFAASSLPRKTIENSVGLFKYFLQHEMFISSFLNGGQFQIKFLYEGCDFFIAQIFQNQFIAFYDCQFIIIYINDFLGVFDDGRGVGRQEMFSFSDSNDKRTAFSCGNNGIRMVLVQ